MKWYVINVFNSKESKVKEGIDKVIEIDNHTKHVEQVLVPKERYFQIRNSKKIKAERNYFPGYVFIECDMNGELMSSINSVKGVISFLKGSNGPVHMSDREVKNMLSKVEEVQITDEVAIDKMYQIGENLGIAFQLQDDILDAFGTEKIGKRKGGDIISNKKTYLLITALKKAKGKTLEELEKWTSLSDFDEEEKIKAVLDIFDELNIKEISEKEMSKYSDIAFSMLEDLKLPEHKKVNILSVMNTLLKRDY